MNMASNDPVLVHSTTANSRSESSSDNEESTERLRDVAHAMELSLSERIKVRCSPQVSRIRWVRSKGAILVLLWNCLIANNVGPLSSIISGILHLHTSDEKTITFVRGVFEGLSFALLYPLAGWLADVYFGRYKVIHTSLQLMWVGVVAITVCVCIQLGTGVQLLPFQFSILPLALLAVQCGIAGFKANAIPFGTDQLMEGSSKELSAYIHWYVFTIAINVVSVPFSCFGETSDNILLLQLFVQAAFLTLALCLDFCFRKWLVIEPGTRNPFKTIYQVLNYAWKNKRAKFRSAFTYHVEEIPSRIELAKPEYGGPFTVEQVEDVKTFLRMLSVVIPMSLAFLMAILADGSLNVLSAHIASGLNCVVKDAIGTNYPVIIQVLFLPLYEFFLYPFFHSFIPSMLRRVVIGTIFTTASFVAQLAIDVIGHRHAPTGAHSAINVTASTCIFTDGSADLKIDYGWIVVPGTLLSIGLMFHLIAFYEFVFAQAPHSMKGLFIGLIYGTQGIFRLINLVLNVPFLYGVADTSQAFPTCGFFFYLMNIVIIMAALIWYSCAARKYKKRERDTPERLHMFAEEYYDKYLTMRNNMT